jgi:small-conductance mechanosensitive channel
MIIILLIRIFNNFYSQLNLNKRWRMLLGFDLGLQQKYQQANEYNFWYSPIFISQFSFNDKLKAAIRFERYQDKKNIIVAVAENTAFVANGLSLNTDYFITPNLLCRMELRGLYSSSNTFRSDVGSIKNNRFFATSMAYKF